MAEFCTHLVECKERCPEVEVARLQARVAELESALKTAYGFVARGHDPLGVALPKVEAALSGSSDWLKKRDREITDILLKAHTGQAMVFDAAMIGPVSDAIRAHDAEVRRAAIEEAAKALEGEHHGRCVVNIPASATTVEVRCGRCEYARRIRALASPAEAVKP